MLDVDTNDEPTAIALNESNIAIYGLVAVSFEFCYPLVDQYRNLRHIDECNIDECSVDSVSYMVRSENNETNSLAAFKSTQKRAQ